MTLGGISSMKEYRCKKCQKLIAVGELKDGCIKVKCNRCKIIREIKKQK